MFTHDLWWLIDVRVFYQVDFIEEIAFLFQPDSTEISKIFPRNQNHSFSNTAPFLSKLAAFIK